MNKIQRLFIIGITIFSCLNSIPIPKTAMAAVPEAEKNALTELYNATNGPGWTNSHNWNTPNRPDPCVGHWYGVYCNSSKTHVTQLNLPANNLTGTIPASLCNLTQIEDLQLYGNHLSGPIPASLGNLTQLYSLDLADNNLSGPIPVSFCNRIQLHYLMLRYNQLCGRVPSTLINLINLHDNDGLNLDHNRLITQVDSTLGDFITRKSSHFADWSTTQDSQSCFVWPMFLPAITGQRQ